MWIVYYHYRHHLATSLNRTMSRNHKSTWVSRDKDVCQMLCLFYRSSVEKITLWEDKNFFSSVTAVILNNYTTAWCTWGRSATALRQTNFKWVLFSFFPLVQAGMETGWDINYRCANKGVRIWFLFAFCLFFCFTFFKALGGKITDVFFLHFTNSSPQRLSYFSKNWYDGGCIQVVLT